MAGSHLSASSAALSLPSPPIFSWRFFSSRFRLAVRPFARDRCDCCSIFPLFGIAPQESNSVRYEETARRRRSQTDRRAERRPQCRRRQCRRWLNPSRSPLFSSLANSFVSLQFCEKISQSRGTFMPGAQVPRCVAHYPILSSEPIVHLKRGSCAIIRW